MVFNGPRYQNVMPDGTLIVADKFTHSVKIIAVDGALLQVIGEGQVAKGPGKFTSPEGVELKGDILWIAESGNHRIVKYRMIRRSKDPHTHGRYRKFLCGALGLRLYWLEASVGSGRRRGGARIDHRPFDWQAFLAANGPNPTNGLTPQRRAYFSGREI